MKTNLNKNHLRQGDVALAKVSEKFDVNMELKKRESQSGRLILAYGEATGHHHSISLLDYPDAELFDVVGEAEKMLLRIGEKGAVIEHQEHAHISLKPGWYEVHIQTEYDPESEELERRVAD